PPAARQLQDGGLLALTKIGHQHDLSIRELQRIVMRCWTVHVDLPKAGNLVRRFPGRQETERGVAFDLFFECKLGPRKQTYGNARLTWICEAARDGIGELCRDQFVTDLRRSGRYVVETVVTHRTPPVCAQPRRRPSALRIAAKQHDLLM